MNHYLWNRVVTPIVLVVTPLVVSIPLIVQTRSQPLTYVGWILNVWAILALISLNKVIFLMRKVEPGDEGLIMKDTLIKWEDIDELSIPWSRRYINVRYKQNGLERYFIIPNPYTFKDSFRNDFRTEYFDKLYVLWRKKRPVDQNNIKAP